LIASRVAALTDNKFQIQTFAAGEIVPGLQVLDAVQNGTVERGTLRSTTTSARTTRSCSASALPFGMNPRQQNAWLIHGGGQTCRTSSSRPYNSHFIPAGNTNAQMGGWFRKPLVRWMT
jgi:TRAP-type mannitol/chloroaromatic compound transport system substrate-binding protein